MIYLALLLDALVGDPPTRLHPVRMIGAAAAWVERRSAGHTTGDPSRGAETAAASHLVRRGLLAWICVVAGAVLAAGILLVVAGLIHIAAAVVMGTLLIASTVAVRDLYAHGRRVLSALEAGDLSGARAAVGMMVSRETGNMNETEVIRAAIESLAENLSDGVAAPLFYAALAGPAGALAYRAINTLDAMWGYRNARYCNFGRMAARSDDVANRLPARITAAAVAALAPLFHGSIGRAWRVTARDARKSHSPNAGWPEAAVAGALGVRLGGPARYFGEVRESPLMGGEFPAPGMPELAEALRLVLIVPYSIAGVTLLPWLAAVAGGIAPLYVGVFGLVGAIIG